MTYYALAYKKYENGDLDETVKQDGVTPRNFRKHMLGWYGEDVYGFVYAYFDSAEVREEFVKLLEKENEKCQEKSSML